ncbi:MAG: DUF3696 domain-containing protein [Candidatus Krumholzibacteriia bacterium]
MITELSFTNFKSWKRVKKMRFAPITGLFGTNSSGKTGIIQLLLMLKQTVESPDRAQVLIFGDERTTPVNLGSYREIIHAHELSRDLSWRIRWNAPEQLEVMDTDDPKRTLFKSGDLGFEVKLAAVADRPQVIRMTYQLGANRFTMSKKGKNGDKYTLDSETQGFTFVRTQGRPWDLPAPVKCYGFPDQVKTYFQNTGFLADLQWAFEKMFGRVYYLGPLREYPKRQYMWAGAEPADMGQRGERVVDALLASRDRGNFISMGKGNRKRSLEEHVAWWLRELGLVHSFTVEPEAKDSSVYRVRVRKTQYSTEALITDVGFGVSQILPALVLCYYVPEGSTIVLEQPEIHLHPSVQAGLADVFIDAIERRNIQVLFESHSEHLLRRLQRRIAEDKLKLDKAAFYFCEMVKTHSMLSPLELDLYGNISNWPKDFFGDQFGEMAEMTKAALGRKAQKR